MEKLTAAWEYEGNVFQVHGGGKWDGADDHETCFMIVWDSEAVYHRTQRDR